MLIRERVVIPCGVVALFAIAAAHQTPRGVPAEPAIAVVADEPEVSSRSAAHLDAPPAWTLRVTCDSRGAGWGAPVDLALDIRDTAHGLEATGTLAFVGRRTRAALAEVSAGTLVGSMVEIDGLDTVWHLRLEIRDAWIRLYEVYDQQTGEALICAIR